MFAEEHASPVSNSFLWRGQRLCTHYNKHTFRSIRGVYTTFLFLGRGGSVADDYRGDGEGRFHFEHSTSNKLPSWKKTQPAIHAQNVNLPTQENTKLSEGLQAVDSACCNYAWSLASLCLFSYLRARSVRG